MKVSTPAPTTKPSIGYSDDAKMYIEYSARSQRSEEHWRKAFFSLSALFSISLIANIYQSQLPRQIPYVVHELGNGSKGIELLRPAERPDAKWIKYQLSQWITDTRTISADPNVRELMQKHTAMLLLDHSSAAQTVAQYLSSVDTNQRVNVSLNYIRPQANSTNIFDADWIETPMASDGRTGEPQHWNATIALEYTSGNISLPNDEDPDYVNPFGMYISTLNWGREAS